MIAHTHVQTLRAFTHVGTPSNASSSRCVTLFKHTFDGVDGRPAGSELTCTLLASQQGVGAHGMEAEGATPLWYNVFPAVAKSLGKDQLAKTELQPHMEALFGDLSKCSTAAPSWQQVTLVRTKVSCCFPARLPPPPYEHFGTKAVPLLTLSHLHVGADVINTRNASRGTNPLPEPSSGIDAASEAQAGRRRGGANQRPRYPRGTG